YRLEGVPSDHLDPIEIRVRYDGTPPDSSYLAVGETFLLPMTGESAVGYFLHEATSSSGYLIGQIDPVESTARREGGDIARLLRKAVPPDMILWVLGVTDLGARYSPVEGHFRVFYPQEVGGIYEQLPTYLEAAYDSFAAISLVQDERRFPIDAPVVTFPGSYESRYALFVAARPGRFAIFFNKELAVNLPPLAHSWFRQTSMREYLHCIGSTYDPNYFLSDHSVNPGHFWLHAATSTWAEGIGSGVNEYVPKDFPSEDEMAMAAFKGMQAGAGTDPKQSWDHGTGMSAVIKYLVDHYRKSVITRIYDGLKNHDVPVAAVLNSVEDTPRVWWPDFFKEYVGGNIYKGCYSVLSYYTEGVFKITKPEDSTQTFSASYPDLSAKAFMISLNYTTLGADDSLKFSVTVKNSKAEPEDVSLLLFGETGTTFSQVTSLENLTVSKLRAHTNNSGELYAIVVNSHSEAPYTGTSEIDLEVSFKPVPSPIPFKQCNFSARAIGHFIDSNDGIYDYDLRSYDCCSATGEFVGNTFETIWNRPYSGGNGTSRGHMKIVLDRVKNEISTFTAIDTTNDDDTGERWISRVEGSNVPFDYEWEGVHYYRVWGTSVCDLIQTFTYRADMDDFWREGDLLGCDGESSIVFAFSE
ncbi:hypothetical protein ACFL6M_06765, partial [Candidatus Eisenbacteria bacterium]